MKSKIDPQKVLEFQALLHRFALVERVADIPERDNPENDVEHSYKIAMLAWYVVDAFKLPLDKGLVMRYALAHDLVEAYAGDTYILDEEAKKTKAKREKDAQKRIASEFPEFEELQETIEAYERQEDAESRFIKAFDKVEPVLSNFAQNGRTWKRMNVAANHLYANKREKTAPDQDVRDLLEEIIALIGDKTTSYFVR